MAITVVQSAGNHAESSTTVAKAFTGAFGAVNNRVIVMANISSTSYTPVSGDCTSSGDVTGGFTLRVSQDVSGGSMSAGDHMHLCIWDGLVTGTASARTITIANMPANSFALIAIVEAHGSVGTVTYDNQNDTDTSTDTSHTPNALIALTPSSYEALFVAGVGLYSSNTTTVTPTAGQSFTEIFEDQAGATDAVGNFIFKVVTSGSQAMTWSAPSSPNQKPFTCAEAVYVEAAGAVSISPGLGSEGLSGKTPLLGFGIDMPNQAMGITGRVLAFDTGVAFASASIAMSGQTPSVIAADVHAIPAGGVALAGKVLEYLEIRASNQILISPV